MTESDFTEFVFFLGTRRRLYSFCQRIDGILASFSKTMGATPTFDDAFSDEEIVYLKKLQILNTTAMQALRDRLAVMPAVQLRVAFQPSIRFTEELIVFFRDRITELHVLEIIVDDALIAGAVVEYKGRHYDFSWLTLIREGHHV
jgi:nicotinic acid phosphoribosyltransferase